MTKTTYKVTGATNYGGYEPGEEFEAELDPAAERRAVERGSLRVVKRPDTEDKPKTGKKKEGSDA